MNATHLVSFVGGAALMLGLSLVSQSNAQSTHVFELRIYTVNPRKLEALKARFGNHTDAIFKKHNIIKRIGYLGAAGRAGFEEPFHLHG